MKLGASLSHRLGSSCELFAFLALPLPAAKLAWSIEDWIHSKRRNMLGQKLVERLVRAHMNMAVDRALDEAKKKLLPWDIELLIEEPQDLTGENPEDSITIEDEK